MAIQPTYTGTNSGAAAPFNGGAALNATDRGFDRIIGAKREKVHSQKQDAQAFQEGLAVDPIQVIDQSVMLKQAEMLEGFQTKWSNIMNQRQGELTENDKAMMASDRRSVATWQNGILSKQDALYKEASGFIPGKHDKEVYIENFSNAVKDIDNYMPGQLLEAVPMGYQDYVTGLDVLARKTTKGIGDSSMFTGTSIGNDIVYMPRWDEQTARQAHYNYVMSDPSRTKTATKSWENMQEWQREEIMDMVETNNANVPDETELRNAIIEADFQANKGMFLDERRKVGSTPYWQYKEGQSQPKNIIQNVIDTGGGSSESGADFVYGDGVSSQFMGSSISGITFDYSKVTSPNKGWISIPTATIEDKPENMYTEDRRVKARPQVAANGKVEWVAEVPVLNKVEKRDYLSAKGDDKANYIEKNGKWYLIEYKEETITTSYDDVYTIIDNSFPGFSDLYQSKNLGQSGQGTVWD